MRMGTVLPMPLGRVKGMSRQCGNTEGQSASVAQYAEQLPIVMLMPLLKHWPLSQYCIGSVSDVGVSGHAMPDVSRPKGARQ